MSHRLTHCGNRRCASPQVAEVAQQHIRTFKSRTSLKCHLFAHNMYLNDLDERRVVEESKSDAVMLLGRSGTGKTLCVIRYVAKGTTPSRLFACFVDLFLPAPSFSPFLPPFLPQFLNSLFSPPLSPSLLPPLSAMAIHREHCGAQTQVFVARSRKLQGSHRDS